MEETAQTYVLSPSLFSEIMWTWVKQYQTTHNTNQTFNQIGI